MQQNKNKRFPPDIIIISIYIILSIIGLISIYSASYQDGINFFSLSFKYIHVKQFVWILTGLLLFVLIIYSNPHLFSNAAEIFYGVILVLLFLVLVIGAVVGGNRAWLDIGNGIRLQPSEFAKYTTALLISKIWSDPDAKRNINKTMRNVLIVIAIPMLLIFLQKDIGTMLIFFAFILALYREGLPSYVIFIGFWFILVFILSFLIKQFIFLLILTAITLIFIFIFRKKRKLIIRFVEIYVISIILIVGVNYFYKMLMPHHQERIEVMLGLKDDPKGASWNLRQSMIAIGSGGLTGKGFLEGSQTQMKFVPEQTTDFIFCAIGEEWGFIGALVVLSLYLILLLRILKLAERQRSIFSRVYGYSVASLLFLHIFINIGMTVGLVPVIGIPLPFISYGGSSYWAFTLLLATFVNLDMYHNDVI
ncbi:MAG TPA: rod shape-determining protein RodA [Bacteroidales bacterium]|jgi:rod shape determining protein RodA|nr:rod shape-determining protein RodA [Bacteroidales bacterium]HOB27234.1 rod shape-determining protein RodA [Bacteroidales bacterium]HOL74614.1 rod shape-determining protein RodA [Bacteroidales bacterium]HPU46055.1 rod shape-determining protein RodA [Bacteroidales bacterium]HPZ36546.1 rod shape-determining protein RodA [Bacteroidales bacterium]